MPNEYGLEDGQWYRASDGNWYCWPNPTPYPERPVEPPAPPPAAPPTPPAPMPSPFDDLPAMQPGWSPLDAPPALIPHALPTAAPARPPRLPTPEHATAGAGFTYVPPPPKRSVLPTILRVGVVLLVLGGGAAFALNRIDDADRDDKGTVTTTGKVTVKAIRAGDCAAEVPAEGRVETVRVTPCALPHGGEFYYVHVFPGSTYPGAAEVARITEAACVDRLRTYVGVPTGDPGYRFYQLTPTESSWAGGDHDSTCLLYDPSGRSMTGSAKGKGALKKPASASPSALPG